MEKLIAALEERFPGATVVDVWFLVDPNEEVEDDFEDKLAKAILDAEETTWSAV